LTVATERAPNARELADLKFAFRVCKHVKSNAIVFAKHGATTGIGAGQMSRVDAARIAAWRCCGFCQYLTRRVYLHASCVFSTCGPTNPRFLYCGRRVGDRKWV
jgi:hypothetical protein